MFHQSVEEVHVAHPSHFCNTVYFAEVSVMLKNQGRIQAVGEMPTYSDRMNKSKAVKI